MQEDEYTVYINPILEDLMPGFLQNRQNEVISLEQMCLSRDFDSIKRLGHQLKGVGPNYGFQKLGEMGAAIELAADHRKIESINLIIQAIRNYLAHLKIQFQ